MMKQEQDLPLAPENIHLYPLRNVLKPLLQKMIPHKDQHHIYHVPNEEHLEELFLEIRIKTRAYQDSLTMEVKPNLLPMAVALMIEAIDLPHRIASITAMDFVDTPWDSIVTTVREISSQHEWLPLTPEMCHKSQGSLFDKMLCGMVVMLLVENTIHWINWEDGYSCTWPEVDAVNTPSPHRAMSVIRLEKATPYMFQDIHMVYLCQLTHRFNKTKEVNHEVIAAMTTGQCKWPVFFDAFKSVSVPDFVKVALGFQKSSLSSLLWPDLLKVLLISQNMSFCPLTLIPLDRLYDPPRYLVMPGLEDAFRNAKCASFQEKMEKYARQIRKRLCIKVERGGVLPDQISPELYCLFLKRGKAGEVFADAPLREAFKDWEGEETHLDADTCLSLSTVGPFLGKSWKVADFTDIAVRQPKPSYELVFEHTEFLLEHRPSVITEDEAEMIRQYSRTYGY